MAYGPKVVLSITAPVYNEQDNIEKLVLYWESLFERHGINGEIVLTDDGSTDGTPAILDRLKRRFANLVLVTFEANQGYGKALARSIAQARGEFILTIDSDGQFDAGEYTSLLKELEDKGYGLVTGYRMGKKDNFARVAADRSLNLLIRAMFRVSLRDTNCALKLARAEVLKRIRIEARGYPTPTEITIKLKHLGVAMGEVGIKHLPRQGGVSKLKFMKTSFHMLCFLIYLKWKIALWKWGVLGEL